MRCGSDIVLGCWVVVVALITYSPSVNGELYLDFELNRKSENDLFIKLQEEGGKWRATQLLEFTSPPTSGSVESDRLEAGTSKAPSSKTKGLLLAGTRRTYARSGSKRRKLRTKTNKVLQVQDALRSYQEVAKPDSFLSVTKAQWPSFNEHALELHLHRTSGKWALEAREKGNGAFIDHPVCNGAHTVSCRAYPGLGDFTRANYCDSLPAGQLMILLLNEMLRNENGLFKIVENNLRVEKLTNMKYYLERDIDDTQNYILSVTTNKNELLTDDAGTPSTNQLEAFGKNVTRVSYTMFPRVYKAKLWEGWVDKFLSASLEPSDFDTLGEMFFVKKGFKPEEFTDFTFDNVGCGFDDYKKRIVQYNNMRAEFIKANKTNKTEVPFGFQPDLLKPQNQ